MVFSSPIFLFLFLPAVLTAYHLAPRPARNGILLAASLLFYAWGEVFHTGVMLASVALNYAAGLWIARAAGRRRTAVVAAAVAANLLMLGWFKYATFLGGIASAALGGRWRPPDVHLPIGISFFTFQAMSYVIDLGRGRAGLERNPLRLGLFISLFPQLIAGPIVRYIDIVRDLSARRETLERFASGIRRFTVGLGKKMLIANVLAEPADRVFALAPADLTAPLAWLGVAAYTAQIYFDFSGYSDMAIGLGRMFGFEFPENFRHPYAARSVTEFWRRWHITLSTWFRDYLYVPLGGNRRGPVRTAVNLLAVFLLCGLWHGAAWNFVVWGLYHGALLAAERPWRGRRAPAASAPLRHAYTLLAVMAGWVVFRATSLSHAAAVLRALVGGGAEEAPVAFETWCTPYVALTLVLAAVGSTPWGPALAGWLRDRAPARLRAGFAPSAAAWAALPALATVWGLCWLKLAAGTHNPFIYFRF